MRTAILTVCFFVCGLASNSAAAAPKPEGPMDALLQELVALERSALDRWITLDPEGYLALYGPDVTYFDPTTERRVVGLTAIQARLAPLKGMKLPFSDPRYELIEPKVQRHGEVAILTFNLVNHGKLADGVEREVSHWNSTEVYSRIGGKWKIVHSHWSFVKPQLKQPSP